VGSQGDRSRGHASVKLCLHAVKHTAIHTHPSMRGGKREDATPSEAVVVDLKLEPGWTQHIAPAPLGDGCSTSTCRFASVCYDQRVSVAALCSRAECCACAFCRSGPQTTWSTPDGILLESLTTATEPPFVYAYNPLDQDMLFVRHRLLVEPELTRIWSNSTRECCAAPNGVVVDVGSNFGWYAMLSLSLGCSVVAFEPVRAYQDVIRLAVHLNGASFAKRLTVYGNAVLDKPGNFSMLVPLAGVARTQAQPSGGSRTRPTRRPRPMATLATHMRTHMGMAALLGPRGQAAVKDVSTLSPGTLTYRQPIATVRIDAVLQQPLCMLKIDIEGLEPQALSSAVGLLSLHRVRVVQLEVTRKKPQTCANVRMLRNLLLLGFELHKVREGATDCHRLPPIATDCHRLPPGATDCRRLPPIATDCHRLPPGATDCHGLPPIAAHCH
jgi:FkbM family methyltransferase